MEGVGFERLIVFRCLLMVAAWAASFVPAFVPGLGEAAADNQPRCSVVTWVKGGRRSSRSDVQRP